MNLKDTVRIVADARGKIVTDKLQYGKEYELKITAKGYKSHSVIIDSKEFIKEYKVLIEKEGSISKEFSKVNISKIYPNPVQRSGIVNIDFSNLKEEKIRVMLFSFDGSLINEKLVDAIRGQNSFRFVIDSELPGGIYLLQLSDRYGKNFVVKQLGVY